MKRYVTALTNNPQVFCLFMFAVVIGLLIFSPDSHATNHLKGLKTDIADTFGANSDVPYYLLLGEGFIGAFTYIKTKNPLVLGGVPILMIFTHFALS